MVKKVLVTCLGLVMLASATLAAEGKLEGVLLAQYLSMPATGVNSFDVTRLYLTYVTDLASNIKMRYTTDLARSVTPEAKGAEFAFAKYAWLEVSKMVPGGGRLRLGLIETPWIGFEDGIWGYRVQGSNFADRLGIISSADFGMSLDGKILDNLEYFGALINGAGYKSTETDKSKRTELRLTARPVNNVSVSGFVSKDYWSNDPGKPRERLIGQVAYKDSSYTLAGDYLIINGSSAAGKNGNGYSIFGTAKLDSFLEILKGHTVIARIDQYDPDSATGSDASTRQIAGISYELIKGTLILFDVDRLRTESGAGSTTLALAQIQVKF